MIYSWHDVLGIAGVILILVSYLLLQMGRLDANTPAYSLSNALGSVLILISLSHNFNLSAFVIEGVWLLISLYGFTRFLARR